MPNQMIALQARNPQLPDPSRQTAQFANMMNMARQQETAQLQGERARQEMAYATAKEGREAELQPFAVTKASSEASGARLKYFMDFFETSEIAIGNSRNSQQAMALGDRMKQMFPEPAPQESIDATLSSLPQDPSQFEAWREDSLFRTMEAKDQLAQEYIKQTTGTEERVIGLPKFGGGAAREVSGSRIQVAEGMQYVTGADGAVYAMPKTTTGGFATPPPPAGSSGSGSPVANALKTNPGALKDGPFAQSQPGYTGKSGGFATFDTPAAGIAAQEKLLLNSYINKGANTINKIVNKYAPQGPENSAASVSGYKEYIRRRTGVDINTPITAAQIPAVAKAMREFETDKKVGGSGTAGAPVAVIPGSSKTASTEDERKISSNVRLAASAAREMAKVLREDPASIAPGGTEYAAGQVPFYGKEAAKFAQSGPRQRFDAALAKFVLAATYITTGAGVAAPQIEDLRTSFFPTYQDTARSRQSKLLGALQFVRDAKDRAGSLWTPELESELNTLEKLFQNPASYKPKAKAATPTKSSDGWGSAKQVGN